MSSQALERCLYWGAMAFVVLIFGAVLYEKVSETSIEAAGALPSPYMRLFTLEDGVRCIWTGNSEGGVTCDWGCKK